MCFILSDYPNIGNLSDSAMSYKTLRKLSGVSEFDSACAEKTGVENTLTL